MSETPEKLVSGDIAALDIGRTRYTQFTNQQGGILDGSVEIERIQDRSCNAIGTKLNLIVRGKALPATVVALPFVPNNFKCENKVQKKFHDNQIYRRP